MLMHALKIAEAEHGRESYVCTKTMRNIVFVRPIAGGGDDDGDGGGVQNNGWTTGE